MNYMKYRAALERLGGEPWPIFLKYEKDVLDKFDGKPPVTIVPGFICLFRLSEIKAIPYEEGLYIDIGKFAREHVLKYTYHKFKSTAHYSIEKFGSLDGQGRLKDPRIEKITNANGRGCWDLSPGVYEMLKIVYGEYRAKRSNRKRQELIQDERLLRLL